MNYKKIFIALFLSCSSVKCEDVELRTLMKKTIQKELFPGKSFSKYVSVYLLLY
jgi:hypothetical protein